MNGRLLLLFVLIASFFFCAGCDKGLNPDPSGFSGTIFLSNWPPPDSVWELRLVAFKNPPTDSSNLFLEWARGNVLVYPPVGTTAFKKTDSTGRFVDSIKYTVLIQGIDVDEPVRYSYIALAWRYSPNVFTDWRPAGLYAAQPYSFVPKPLVLAKHQFISNVDLYCDFRNPPPRPWQ